jgi:MFS family permease
MSTIKRRPFGDRYAFVVAGVTFVCLLVAAGRSTAPGVLMLPLQQAFGWERGVVSLAAATSLFLFGLVGPFAGALMQTLGIKRTLLGGLILMASATFASLWMSQPWHYLLTWGVISGLGSGAVATVLGATVVNRWFVARRGLMMGILSASTATGALVFLPLLAKLSEIGGWRYVVIAICTACITLIPLVLLFMAERPADIGQRRFGATEPDPAPTPGDVLQALRLAFGALSRAARTPAFWILFGTFFVCGLTTNGLVGTHLIAFCGDHNIAAVSAAGLLAFMGLFDLVGTTASGWLTDRYDPRKLLFVYYALRGLSLIALPFSNFDLASLSVFTVFYGLDWIATVPPTLRLTTDNFGERDAPVVFGWIFTGHQIGAATAAFGAGALRDLTGEYLIPFVIAGGFGVLAAFLALSLRRPREEAAAQPA